MAGLIANGVEEGRRELSLSRLGGLRRGAKGSLAGRIRAAGLGRPLLIAAVLLATVPLRAAEAAPPVSAAAPPGAPAGIERNHVEAQLANVQRLLESSTAAQRVLASDDGLARSIREDALERFRAAQAAFAAGDHARTKQLLNEAAKSMFQAIRQLGPASDVAERKTRDFEERAASTQVLLEALARIAREEGGSGNAARSVATVQRTIAAARELLGQGRIDDGRRLLDGAYEIAKAEVEALRDGKTLVRSLKFDSVEDEYRYELDRNDTHRMLVKVLTADKPLGGQAGAKVAELLQSAAELRTQAQQKAGAGEFRDAIRLLERSTQNLVHAIRNAGVYIPG